MDINKAVQEKFAEVLESGLIEKKIKESLEKTVTSAVEDALRSYSDVGKAISESVKAAIGIKRLDLPDYNQLVSTWVQDLVQGSMITVGRQQIEKNLKEFFQPLEKQEWLLSEIVEQFKNSLREDGESGEITLIVEGRGISSLTPEYWSVYIDSDSKKSKFSCDYQIHINKTGVWRVEIDGHDSRKMKSLCLYGFEDFLFKLYSNGCQIINDEDNVSLYYGRDYDD